MPQIRSFIAIEIPEDIRNQIADVQEILKKEPERISWTKAANMHLTLKFLGDVEQNLIPDIGKTLNEISQTVKSFTFRINGLGAFPNLKRARVLWIGIENPGSELEDIAKKIEDSLIQFGFSKENRKFKPHLTLGRVKSQLSADFINKFNKISFEGGVVLVREIKLIKSDLKPTGAVYTPIQIVNLK